MTDLSNVRIEDPVDLLVVGAGVNGAGIARDAAGRGLSVGLCEKDDIASGTSSRSGKLVHGGLRYLEYYEFRLVREALIEREVLLRSAPHIIWPMRFVLPHDRSQRPAWLVRLGLFLYDHLGGRRKLPGCRVLDLRKSAEGEPLLPEYTKAFEYSDCWVDDARLVVLNARSAAQHGAVVLPRVACQSIRREDSLWRATLRTADGHAERELRARVVVNAAGPWVEKVLAGVAGYTARSRIRLVRGSHLIVRRLYDGPQAYLIQNTDKRVIFVNPYEGDYNLIGTTDIPQDSDPDQVAISAEEVAYLCAAVNRYFKRRISPADVVHSFSGVRPLYDDAAENPSAVTRDYVFDIDAGAGRAPMLSIYGGKITTYRKLAEHALEKLKPFLPKMGAAWTEDAPLPGGDMPDADFDAYAARFRAARPWLPAGLATQYLRRYGTLAERMLGDARSLADLGRHFGADLYEREARYLIEEEWAMTAEDILERRTKHYLHLSATEIDRFAAWLAREAGPPRARAV